MSIVRYIKPNCALIKRKPYEDTFLNEVKTGSFLKKIEDMRVFVVSSYSVPPGQPIIVVNKSLVPADSVVREKLEAEAENRAEEWKDWGMTGVVGLGVMDLISSIAAGVRAAANDDLGLDKVRLGKILGHGPEFRFQAQQARMAKLEFIRGELEEFVINETKEKQVKIKEDEGKEDEGSEGVEGGEDLRAGAINSVLRAVRDVWGF